MSNPKESRSVDLQGRLAQAEIVDLLQFLHGGGKTGELFLTELPGGGQAHLYFLKGNLVHAKAGAREGMDVLLEIPTWKDGNFQFTPNILSPRATVEMPLPHILMEAIRLYDERMKPGATLPEEEGKEMKNLNALLTELVRIEGISTAVLVGRDGFVIDGATSGGALDAEAIGAVISTGIGSSEVMGRELCVGDLCQTMIEFKEGIIVVNLVGDNAILAVVACLKTPLGNIRFQVKKRLPEIMQALN